MIKTAIRTTIGANKNKNATIAINSENGIGSSDILTVIVDEAKPARSVPSGGALPAKGLRIDFGRTRCTNAG
jgi:hypothetical protein